MIQLQQVELRRGPQALFSNADLTVFPGQKVGIIGANGCGKSSLFAMLLGKLHADAGNINIPERWVVSTVAQETPALDCSAMDYVLQGDEKLFPLLLKARSQCSESDLANVHLQIEALDGYRAEAKAGVLLDGLGFSGEAQQQSVKSFSGGWRMRLNLAKALMQPAELLLLDEPTNHLDLDAVLWLEKYLANYQGTLLLISHDRDFLDAVTDNIVHIERQTLTLYKGNYSQFERQRAEQLSQHQANFDKQQRQVAHLQKFIDRFKAQATKARQAQSRIKALERMTILAPAHVDSPFSFSFREPKSLPNPLLKMENVQAGYTDNIILSQIKFQLLPGSRIGLLGRNGAGKSTLIKLLSGSMRPQSGEIWYANGVSLGYFAQHQLETLRPQDSPLQHLVRLDPLVPEQKLRDFLGGFGFHGDKALEACAPFSGGEKARLVLALIVYQRPNLLLLDEPTNHLDLDMREAIVMALQEFEGAIVIVSHDRHLLSSCTDEFYLVAHGRVAPFDGDLTDYYQWLQQDARQTNNAAIPDTPASSNVVRKDQKRLEAELRNLLRPLKQKIEKLEQQQQKLTTELATIEEKMADPDIYSAERKAELTALLAKQATASSNLASIEEDWFVAQDELEQKTEQFWTNNG
ncbi:MULTISPECIES: ATP-binding cassette domain-containing protein [unclassified Arsukibacterium]|uniref:ATP-binding cassette domain-containing protein n=1 Tax=unclassified Arsukibacterium TaxID=2635278 RepID=UPI000C8B701F|nr:MULTISPECIES: ATP-binding cassette domain-containing protein [unclassified Arsukibacterium]MAA94272.1 ABC transporter ATP-binding protein [Rheinheimera sp.]|tara:strand:- start:10236 stop:12143 length:1908 start_codon:yes stop_codon:yes gene_type:complete